MKINERKKKKKNKGARGGKYLMAIGTMGALLAYSAVDNRTVTSAYGCQPNRAIVSRYLQTQDQSPVRNFNIAPGSLDTVLTAFESLTGVKALIANDSIRDLSSPGVTGVYSTEHALAQLLTGTGVSYKFTAANTISLEIEALSAVVEVKNTAKILSSPKYSEPLLNTPQSITVVPQEIIQAQAATTLRDVLRNVAGISIAAGEGGAQGDNLTIRGFTARNDLFIDGMRDFGSYYRDSFNTEEVAVLKGPSSVTNGRGSTGGTINQATKTPQLNSFIKGSIEVGNDETRRLTLDLNQSLPKLGNGTAFRLNALGNDSEVAGRDVARNRRYGFAPSLEFGLGSPTRLTLSYFHQTANDIPDYGIPYLFDRPAPVPRNTYYGFENGNYLKTRVDISTIKFEHEFNEKFSVRDQVRYTSYSRAAVITGNPAVVLPVTPTTPLEDIKVNRGQIAVDSDESFLQEQLDFTAKFNTGFVNYTLVGGIEAGRETSTPTRFTYTNVPVTSLLNPNPKDTFSGTSTVTSQVRAKGVSFGTYILGTVKLGNHIEATGGVRFDRFDVDFEQFIKPTAVLNRIDNFTSYRGSLVYKPVGSGSIYFNYSTSFNPSAEALSLSASSTDLAPEENKTYEFGSKWEMAKRHLSVRGAIFRTEKNNARETDPTNALLTVLSGKQRVNGFELEFSGRPISHMQLLSSYSYLDSKVLESKFFPKAIGSQLANVPKNTFTFAAIYDLPWRLVVGADGQFIDSRTASSTVPTDPTTGRVKQVPGYWVFNLNAKRPINERIDLQLNIYNIADNYFIDQVHPGHLVPGAGRTIRAGINFRLR